MLKFNHKPLCLALSLLGLSTAATAQLNSNKVIVNSINNDKVTATVSFPAPVTGDLYVAVDVAGTLLFLTNGGALATAPTAFKSNSSFSADITVLDMPTANIPVGVYTVYQVVALPGSDPLVFSNWIGGFDGLSKITFTINMSNNVSPPVTPVVTAVPTVTPTPDPMVTPTVTPTPVVDNTIAGKVKYKSLGCAQSSCHGSNPALGSNRIMTGTSVPSLKAAIQKNPKDMGYLADPADAQFASDADLQAIADYLKSL